MKLQLADLDGARRDFRAEAELLDDLAANNPDDVDLLVRLSSAYSNGAFVEHNSQDRDEAVKAIRSGAWQAAEG